MSGEQEKAQQRTEQAVADAKRKQTRCGRGGTEPTSQEQAKAQAAAFAA